MTAEVRTFRAANMQAALDIVRQEMGDEAVILHTRHIDKRRLLPFFGARQEIEITAGLGPQVRPVRSSVGTVAAAATTKPTEDLAPPPSLLPPRERQDSVGHNVEPPKWSPNDVIVDKPIGRTRTPAPASRPVLPPSRPKLDAAPKPAPAAKIPTTIAARSKMALPAGGNETQALHQRLDTLQRMILELGRERPGTSLQDIPTDLFPVYTRLLDDEVDEDLARELVCKVGRHATKGQLTNQPAMMSLLTGLVEQELRIGTPITAVRGQRKVVALVGPTGVGKTTTLAKLAANLRLRDGLKVGLITVDTYRIAAVEQLKTYAELIELPMKVVTSPAEMRQALDELQGLDLVLIDTAGRSPRDELKIQELKECLEAARVDEVHLVLSLASGLSALRTASQNFKAAGVTSLILTKLDEATSGGLLLQVARELRTPVSYLTTGQNVPDDIEPAHRTRMARLVLGQERVGT